MLVSDWNIWKERISKSEAKSIANIIIKLEEALLIELHQTDGHDMLANRSNSKTSAVIDRQVPSHISLSVVENIRNFTLAPSHHGKTDHSVVRTNFCEFLLKALTAHCGYESYSAH